jgi:hypothetical protein
VIVIAVGAWLARTETTESIQPSKHISRLAIRILEFPIVTWVFIGFLIVYVLLFISPMFLSPALQMNYFAGYIPNLNPIGNDLTVMVDLIKGWVAGNQSPYTIQFYPPLTYMIFHCCFSKIPPHSSGFYLIHFFSYCLSTFVAAENRPETFCADDVVICHRAVLIRISPSWSGSITCLRFCSA